MERKSNPSNPHSVLNQEMQAFVWFDQFSSGENSEARVQSGYRIKSPLEETLSSKGTGSVYIEVWRGRIPHCNLHSIWSSDMDVMGIS